MKCELCGTPVVVVGDVTKHYERTPIDWEKLLKELWRTLPKEDQLGKFYDNKIQELVEKALKGEL